MQRLIGLICLLVTLAGCGVQAPATTTTADGVRQTLRLATTTSTADTGLLAALLPRFEQRANARVEVIAVGTGQALELGANGDADVLLVHARAREDAFIASGDGINRRDVMYNDFVIVGPRSDPAQGTTAGTAREAFARIAATGSVFASRGDDSGTFSKEQAIWASAAFTPTAELGWYRSLGQGMGETLIAANEQRAYTLADRGTFLSMRERLPNLTIVLGGATIDQNTDPLLRNPYGVIQVNPKRHPGVKAELAAAFVAWMIEPETQQRIGAFGRDRFGQPLFYPAATP